MRILVIEDDATIREGLVRCLREVGFAVDQSADGEEGLFLAQEYPVDLAIVDLGLPGLSGMDLIRRLRESERPLPVLILTARDRWQDKVEGLEAGADDYLVKPFHEEELLARVNALLRRARGWSSPRLQCGPLELDTASHEVSMQGRPVELTSFEYKVLEYLMMRAGDVVSKMDLTEHIYDEDMDRDSNTIEVFVGRLRKKLDPDGGLEPIETLRGRGYRLALARSAGVGRTGSGTDPEA